MKIEDALKDLEQRLSSVEQQLKQSAPPPTSIPQGKKIDSSNSQSSSIHFSSIPSGSSPSAVPVKTASSSFDSSSVMAVIGTIFLILAGLFFIKITIDSGWLTPVRQVLIAAGTGLTFFFVPQFFPKAEKEYGAFLAGAGTTILHLTWFGAYFFHHILDANAALVCASLVGIFSILGNFGKGNRLYVLIAMAGTYLSAPIIGYNTGELSVLLIFLMIWNISFSAASIIYNRRDILFISSYYAVFTALLLSGRALSPDQQTDLLTLQLLQFLVFSCAMVAYSDYYKTALSAAESVALLPLLLLFYFSTGHLITAIHPLFAPWFGIVVGAVVFGIYFLAKNLLADRLKSGPVLTTFAIMSLVHSFYFQLLEESARPLASLIIGAAAMLFWRQNKNNQKALMGPLVILFSTFIYGAILSVISVKSIEAMYYYNWAFGAVAILAVFGLTKAEEAGSAPLSALPLILGFAHFEVMLGLYRFSQEISWSGALFVTISWGLYAALILAVAYWRRDKVLGNSALTILLAVSLKAFFYDVSNTSNIIRVVCLLAEGLLLYCCGWIFKKMQAWSRAV